MTVGLEMREEGVDVLTILDTAHMREAALAGAQFHQRAVDGDAMQPRPDAALGLEGVDAAEGGHEGFLHGVARFLFVAQDAARHGEQRRGVMIHELFERVQQLGIELCIDDFGTGYSSLAYLVTLPIDALKIDRSFVATLDSSDEHCELVKTIMSLAHNLGIEVVAEGVETVSQLRRLTALGCEYAQGYLFSEPLSEEAADRLVASGHMFNALIVD